MKELRKIYREEMKLQSHTNFMASSPTHQEDKHYIEWLETRIDPERLAGEIMSKVVSGSLGRMQSDFEDEYEAKIKQTILTHLKKK